MKCVFRRFQIFLMVATLAFLLMPYSAYAESELATELMPLEDELLLFQDIPSVYGASKYEQKITEAPSSVSIITEDEIKKYGYRNFAEILQSIRGFHMTNDRNYDYIGVRGFGIPSDYSNRILILIDNHKINENVYDSPGIANFNIDIDLSGDKEAPECGDRDDVAGGGSCHKHGFKEDGAYHA